MNKIDTVLFDLDETILDRKRSLHDFVSWQAGGMLRSSIQDEDTFCRRFIELDSNGAVWKDQVYSQLIEEFRIQDWSVSELLTSYELCFSGFCRLIPNVATALHTLNNQGYKLGIVSNGKSPFQERNFSALGVSHLFGTVVVSEAVGFRKPDSDIFKYACDKLGTIPANAAFVGDNPVADIGGANRVGMYSVYIPRQFGPACEYADSICTDYSHLTNIIAKAT